MADPDPVGGRQTAAPVDRAFARAHGDQVCRPPLTGRLRRYKSRLDNDHVARASTAAIHTTDQTMNSVGGGVDAKNGFAAALGPPTPTLPAITTDGSSA